MKNVFKMMCMALAACTMFVACGGEDTETYTIKVKANDDAMGTVTGGGKYEAGQGATITATANAGYEFVQWDDGDKVNPRNIIVNGDATYTAIFAEQEGVKVVFGNSTWSAATINGGSNSSAFQVAAAQSKTEDYPIALIYYQWDGSLTTGTYTGECSVDPAAGTASAGNPYMWYFSSAERAMTLGDNPCGDWWARQLTLKIDAFDADAMTVSMVGSATMGSLYDCLSTGDWNNAPNESMSMTATNVKISSKAAMPTVLSGKIARK